MCAATILNKRYALTAMHCVQDNGVVAKSAVVSHLQVFSTPKRIDPVYTKNIIFFCIHEHVGTYSYIV